MKKIIFLLCIFILVMGCAAGMKEKRAISKPLVAIAMGKIREGNIQAALVELHRAVRANPSDPEVYMAFALAYRDSSQYDKALENADKAISYSHKLDDYEHPGMQSEAYFIKGTILVFMGGKEDQAVKAFQDSVKDELYPTPELSYNNIALIYYGQKRYPEALDAAKQALNKNAHYAPAWRNLALIYLAQNDEEQAIQALDSAIKEYNGFTEAHWDLAGILIRKGRIREAVGHLQEVVRLDGNGHFGTMAQEKLEELGSGT